MAISRARPVAWPLVAALSALACATTTHTERGDALPDLVDLDGRRVSLAQVAAAHDATVLVWFATTCPCVRRYQARMHALAERHPPQQVAVLAVASNADDDAERLRRVAAERGFRLPILRDEGARLAQALQVTSTPTTVVLDRAGRVAFRGWIDNEREPGEKGRVAWVERALDGLLAGRRDFASAGPFWGCVITRSLFEPPEACHAPPAGSGDTDAP